MIDLVRAKHAFQRYVCHYDPQIPSIQLKIVHTYQAMVCCDDLCQKLKLSDEDRALASLIALLHDIGRFEQWMKYESFADYKTVDHALLSSQLLFEEGFIREFIEDDQYDEIIRHAIEQHNKYQVDDGFDERTLLFIHLMRDADKLDNFRVKDEEDIETLLYVSLDEVNQENISPQIYDQFYQQKLIYGPTRKTHLDMWLSYIAFIFDLYFLESLHYIKEHDWVNRSFNRIQPMNAKTKQDYEILRQRALAYVEDKNGV